MNHLESSTNLQYWNFANWSGSATPVHIVTFSTAQSSAFTSLVFSSQIHQYSRFYSQQSNLCQSVSLCIYFYTVFHLNIWSVSLWPAGQNIYSLPYFSSLLHQCCFDNLLALLNAGILNYAECYYLIALSII